MKKSDKTIIAPGPLTLAALAALAWVVIAVSLAALAPPAYVPHIFHSSHVEHLAAFYIVTLVAMAAFARLDLVRLVAAMIGFAVVLAVLRAFQPAHQLSSVEDLMCDIAGIWAAVAPPTDPTRIEGPWRADGMAGRRLAPRAHSK
jgi:hypothetical protein